MARPIRPTPPAAKASSFAQEMLAAVRPLVQGVQVSAPSALRRRRRGHRLFAAQTCFGVPPCPPLKTRSKSWNPSSINWKRRPSLGRVAQAFEEAWASPPHARPSSTPQRGKVRCWVKQRDGSLKPEPFLTEKP